MYCGGIRGDSERKFNEWQYHAQGRGELSRKKVEIITTLASRPGAAGV